MARKQKGHTNLIKVDNYIRSTIIKTMRKNNQGKAEISRSVASVMTPQLFYAYMRGDTDIGSRRASKLLHVLGLKIVQNKNEKKV